MITCKVEVEVEVQVQVEVGVEVEVVAVAVAARWHECGRCGEVGRGRPRAPPIAARSSGGAAAS